MGLVESWRRHEWRSVGLGDRSTDHVHSFTCRTSILKLYDLSYPFLFLLFSFSLLFFWGHSNQYSGLTADAVQRSLLMGMGNICDARDQTQVDCHSTARAFHTEQSSQLLFFLFKMMTHFQSPTRSHKPSPWATCIISFTPCLSLWAKCYFPGHTASRAQTRDLSPWVSSTL